MGLFTSSSSSTSDQVIDAPQTSFTSQAGYSGAVAAALAGALVVLQGLNVLDITEPVKIACIGLVGAGILAWAIAAAGDSLARAYAVAHVTRTGPEEANQPALQTAANKLAEVYAAAHGIAITDGKGTPVPQAPPIRIPFLQKVKVRGKDAQAFAVEFSGEGDKETRRYFVGLPDSQPTWMSSDAISLPASALESDATSAAVAAPAMSGGTPPPENGSPPTS